jgi:hypothetical protein
LPIIRTDMQTFQSLTTSHSARWVAILVSATLCGQTRIDFPQQVKAPSVVLIQRSVCVDDLATSTAKRLGAISISPTGAPSEVVNISSAIQRLLVMDMNPPNPECAGLELYTLSFSDGQQRVMVAIPDDGNIFKSPKWVAVSITPPGTSTSVGFGQIRFPQKDRVQ